MTQLEKMGLERQVAQGLADAGHQTCPYSRATRGNIDVVINVVDAKPVAEVA